MIRRVLLIIFLTAYGLGGECHDQFALKKDLKESWQVFIDDAYSAYDGEEAVHTIYFSVNANNFRGDHLVLTSEVPFSVFVNGKLIADRKQDVTFSIDSLKKVISTSALFFSIHQEE